IVEAEQFAALLPLLVGHPRISLGRSIEITISNEPLRIPIQARLETNGEITIQLKQRTSAPLCVDSVSGWCFQSNSFRRLALSTAFAGIFSGPIRISRQQVPAFLNHDWPQLAASGLVEANFKLEEF